MLYYFEDENSCREFFHHQGGKPNKSSKGARGHIDLSGVVSVRVSQDRKLSPAIELHTMSRVHVLIPEGGGDAFNHWLSLLSDIVVDRNKRLFNRVHDPELRKNVHDVSVRRLSIAARKELEESTASYIDEESSSVSPKETVLFAAVAYPRPVDIKSFGDDSKDGMSVPEVRDEFQNDHHVDHDGNESNGGVNQFRAGPSNATIKERTVFAAAKYPQDAVGVGKAGRQPH